MAAVFPPAPVEKKSIQGGGKDWGNQYKKHHKMAFAKVPRRL